MSTIDAPDSGYKYKTAPMHSLHSSPINSSAEMHQYRALVVLALLAAAAQAAPANKQDKYTEKYDTVDIDGILASDRLVNNYFNCLMVRGPCTPEGTELRGEESFNIFHFYD
jgi:Insect pheromone-binding family, A10/OS-D